MFGLGGPEMIVLLLIVLVLFGGQKVPELMKGLGQGLREFKKAANEDEPVKKDSETRPTSL